MPAGEGACSFCGRRGPLVKRSPFLPKSELSQKPSGAEDLWQHPCAPLALNSQGIAAVRLSADRPAWTGLAQLLSPLSKAKGKKEHPREGPALVLQQWKTLETKTKRPRLLVLDFDRDKANVKGRFFEAFPLTDHLLGNPDVVGHLRALIDDAQNVRFSLVKALIGAHDDRKQGGLALADAEASFWTASEAPVPRLARRGYCSRDMERRGGRARRAGAADDAHRDAPDRAYPVQRAREPLRVRSAKAGARGEGPAFAHQCSLSKSQHRLTHCHCAFQPR